MFSAINTTPSVFAPTVAGLLIDKFGVTPGLRLCYLASGLFGVLGVGIRSLKLKETYVADSTPAKPPLSHFRDSFVEGI